MTRPTSSTIQDGIILRDDRIVIPQSLKQGLKTKVHAGHQDVNSCFLARHVSRYLGLCGILHHMRNKLCPSNLKNHYKRLAQISSQLPVNVDYYSQFIELDYLPKTKTVTVIMELKYRLAWHGSPDVVYHNTDHNLRHPSSSVWHNFETFNTKELHLATPEQMNRPNQQWKSSKTWWSKSHNLSTTHT